MKKKKKIHVKREYAIEIINAYKSTDENIFKPREIIHRVKGINNGVAVMRLLRVLISAAEYNLRRSLNVDAAPPLASRRTNLANEPR